MTINPRLFSGAGLPHLSKGFTPDIPLVLSNCEALPWKSLREDVYLLCRSAAFLRIEGSDRVNLDTYG